MQKTIISLFVGIVSVAAVQTVSAQVISDWTFESSTPTNSGTYSPEIGNGSASGSHAGAAVYSSPVGNGSAHSYSANTWAVGDYWQFSLSTSGFSGIDVSYDQTGSSTGPKTFFFEYSTDGGMNFTTAGGNYSVLLSTWSSSTNQAQFTYSYDLNSVSALDNNASVVFRIVDAATTSINGGTVATTGTDRVDNFVVSVPTPAPEPSTIALAAVGGVACLLAFRRRN